MKYILLLFFPLFLNSQCLKIDSIYSTTKLIELGNEDIRLGIKQIVEEEISKKYCISEYGKHIGIVSVEIYYFGDSNTDLSVKQTTQVRVRLYVNNKKIEGCGNLDTELSIVMDELIDGKLPFSKMLVSSLIKRAINDTVTKISL